MCRCEDIPSQKRQNLNTRNAAFCSSMGRVWLSKERTGDFPRSWPSTSSITECQNYLTWTIQKFILNIVAITTIDCEWKPRLLDTSRLRACDSSELFTHLKKAALAAASGGDLARSKLGLEIMGTLKVWVDHLRDFSLLSSKFQKQISAWVNGWISLIWSLFLSAWRTVFD